MIDFTINYVINKIMKIVVVYPESNFTKEQRERLYKLGEVAFTKNRDELSLEKLLVLTKDANIIGIDPDPFGGFEKAKLLVTKVIESLPRLKGVCLSTTSFGWVDLDYCRKRKLPVSNIPGYSRESVAEHALALLLCLAKKIILLDRKTREGKYQLEMGFNLKGKTLGIIGLGNIGSRVAELGQAVGMKVIAYNRSPKKQKGVKMVSLSELLVNSDMISLHSTHELVNNNFINEKLLSKMKDGVIIVNTVDRELVDEKAMAKAVKSGKVASYGVEVEDLEHGPLVGLENVIMIKGFAWYTKDSMENLARIWVENIEHLAKGKPQNVVK